MTYPAKDKFDHNLSRRLVEHFTKNDPPDQEFDKTHPDYKYKYPRQISLRILGSAIKNPVGDMWDVFCSFQGYGFCADIEMRMMNCLEAYGLPQSLRKCVDLVEDHHECMTGMKSYGRVDKMRRERSRQFEQGERKFQYAPPPKLGVFLS